MLWALRRVGMFRCALALVLAGSCAKKDHEDDGGDTGEGTGDDGTAGDDGTGGTGGTGSSDGTGGTGSSGGTGGDIQCGTEPVVFPEFDKSCGGDDDCALVFHTINCCGTDVAWGINAGEVAEFDAAEAICDGQFPGCGCPANETEAEDGNTSFNRDDFAVRCDAGACMSYVQ